MKPIEILYQEVITDYLVSLEIYPYNVILIQSFFDTDSRLKISFWVEEDMLSFKEKIKISGLCDQSGYKEFPDYLTVILSGLVLGTFYSICNGNTERDTV